MRPTVRPRIRPIVLITGADRGLGLGLAHEYSRREWKVVNAVRDPSTIPTLEGVCVIKIDAAEVEDAKNAVNNLTEKYGIDHIDVVRIANSAVGIQSEPILDITP
ncbi:hypothetical protein I203_107334 [Kwoniella mangroviensis CBS 8507]|uniref:hypothetical protein n=1 Tax=Kwoniella mangroviensis CBS 8507 TaxID=1296122 RepID=UPI00302DBCFD